MSWATLSAAADRVALDRLGGVSVTAGATTGKGFLRHNSEAVLGGDLVIVDHLLEIETSKFGNLGYGDFVVVDGTNYKTEKQPMRLGDGTWSIVPLILTDETPPPASDDVGIFYYLSVFQ
jgi:hypothetical protein